LYDTVQNKIYNAHFYDLGGHESMIKSFPQATQDSNVLSFLSVVVRSRNLDT